MEVQATDNGSSSVCVKEEATVSDDKDKSDEIQEHIMRLLRNVKIVSDENKVEENTETSKEETEDKTEEKIENNVNIENNINNEQINNNTDNIEEIKTE